MLAMRITQRRKAGHAFRRHVLVLRLQDTMERRMNINERVAWLRTTAGLSQREAADLLGMSWSGIARIERGDRKPSIGTLQKIYKLYGVPISWILGMDGASKPSEQRVRKAVQEARHG
jgi:transcriptional regulator with XRE-family HTH domain